MWARTCAYVLMRCVCCFGCAGAHLCVLTRAYVCTCVCVCRVCVLGAVCVGMLCLGVCRRLHSSHCPAQQTVLVPEVHSQGQEESSSQTSCPGTHSGGGRPMASSGVWAGARVLRAQRWSVSRGQKLAFPFATTDQKSRAWQAPTRSVRVGKPRPREGTNYAQIRAHMSGTVGTWTRGSEPCSSCPFSHPPPRRGPSPAGRLLAAQEQNRREPRPRGGRSRNIH